MLFLDAAFHLVPLGFKVFPLMAGSKIPAIPKAKGGKGCLDATDDEEIIADWAHFLPNANIGIATGRPSNCIVIDLDPRNGSEASIRRLRKAGKAFPGTVTAKTANGGTHFYYAFEACLKNSKSVLAEGIDVKTTGGYVVAPPSVLDGGKRYTWLNSPLGESLPRLPKWVIDALKPKPKPIATFSKASAPKDIAPLAEFVSKAGEGQRNKVLFWAACRAAEDGVLDRSAAETLVNAAMSCGLDKIEAEKTVQSASKRGKL